MKKRVIEQYGVIIASLIILCVTFVPSINFEMVKASHTNDLVEVTIQTCNLQGYEDTTVKLTRQQYQKLTLYLAALQAQLNQTTTPQSAVQLFKDALAELSTYGLLPKGMTVARAQQLVAREQTRMQCTANLVQRLLRGSINYLCLFAGVFHGAFEDNIFGRIGAWFIDHMNPYITVQTILFAILGIIFFAINWVKVIRMMNTINVSGNVDSFFSVGLAGIRNGHYTISRIIGFTGIKIILDAYQPSGYAFYLGFALNIS